MTTADFITIVLVGALTLAAPVVIAGVGEVILERTGGFNVGIEGMMLLGAIAAVLVGREFGAFAGLGAGLIVGAIAGLVFGAATVVGGGDVIIVGIAVGLIGAGLSIFFFQWLAPGGTASTAVDLLPVLPVGPVEQIPILGPVLAGTSVVLPIAIVISIAAWWALRHTRAGLRLSAVGFDPELATSRGIAVRGYRVGASVIAGALAGLGGAAVPLGTIGAFSPGMTGGAGFIALAIVIIARHNPLWLFAGALLFSSFSSVALLAQTGGFDVPLELFQALPYLVTLLLLSIISRRLLVRAWRWRGDLRDDTPQLSPPSSAASQTADLPAPPSRSGAS